MYQLTNTTAIIRTSDGAYIPADPENTDYAEYLLWKEDGNTAKEAEPEPKPDVEAIRRAAYQVEADPLFFKAQRGEAAQADWLAKVEEIKARFPE